MPQVSINILTKNRAELLRKALFSVSQQTFKDFEICIINDGSTDNTGEVIETFKHLNLRTILHEQSVGIVQSRQEVLNMSKGEYVAILDDDDEWLDVNKLQKQVDFLDAHKEYVLVGGGIKISNIKYQISKLRPETDIQIRQTMLLRNNFFTSTVMFNRQRALEVGGFVYNGVDLVEDYDLWLRLGRKGKMYNFQEVFANYHQPDYNIEKFRNFFKKQLFLIKKHKDSFPFYWLSVVILRVRILIGK